ncbi:RNA polymerase sigma factor [Tautonia marina]|uniref:RNA polymerase sigma factor n=1 Tax=Tautonia marina TaxID=2653855 RepID=UPI0012607712|nr:RNA polymerase sigma factor [Tautonia marina]
MVKATGPAIADALTEQSDEMLMSRYREQAQTEDFNELVRRYERELYRYLARYMGDRALADDVFQNTFLQLHLKRGLYEDGRPLRPWLYAIATHQAVDALRKAGRHPTVSLDQRIEGADRDPGALIDLLTGDEPGPLVEMQSEERREWVRQSIAKLPEGLRQTLILAYYQDLKYREIAEILKIPVGTVKSRLHAAVAKLAEMAKAAGPTENGSVP